MLIANNFQPIVRLYICSLCRDKHVSSNYTIWPKIIHFMNGLGWTEYPNLEFVEGGQNFFIFLLPCILPPTYNIMITWHTTMQFISTMWQIVIYLCMQWHTIKHILILDKQVQVSKKLMIKYFLQFVHFSGNDMLLKNGSQDCIC